VTSVLLNVGNGATTLTDKNTNRPVYFVEFIKRLHDIMNAKSSNPFLYEYIYIKKEVILPHPVYLGTTYSLL
jgi:hypothetical protein